MPTKRGVSPSRTTLLVQRAADFEVLMEGAGDALVGAQAAGVIRFINRWNEVRFGCGGELVGRPAEAVTSESVRRGHVAFREGYLTDRCTRVMGAGLELPGLRRADTKFPPDHSLSSLYAAGGQLVPKRCAT